MTSVDGRSDPYVCDNGSPALVFCLFCVRFVCFALRADELLPSTSVDGWSDPYVYGGGAPAFFGRDLFATWLIHHCRWRRWTAGPTLMSMAMLHLALYFVACEGVPPLQFVSFSLFSIPLSFSSPSSCVCRGVQRALGITTTPS